MKIVQQKDIQQIFVTQNRYSSFTKVIIIIRLRWIVHMTILKRLTSLRSLRLSMPSSEEDDIPSCDRQ